MVRLEFRVFLISFFILSSSCAFVPQSSKYKGPTARPAELEEYYTKTAGYDSFKEESIRKKTDYQVKKINVQTKLGEISIDYYQQNEKNDNLILVFPVLGGKNIIADYFAEYFAKQGYDTAIINRNNEFKDPKKFPELERIFADNIKRDRIALDFFENEYQKKNFGSFGISRGAINVALTAGVDPRLKYNVLAMGGSDLTKVFQNSNQNGIKKYLSKVKAEYKINDQEIFDRIEKNIKTDPKYLAQYMDAKNTLMVLAVFDKAVPFKYGEQLREQIGRPDTVYVSSGHLTGILFTQFAKLLLPVEEFCLLPQPYIEKEALSFYNKSFRKESGFWEVAPYRILQMPFSLIGSIFEGS